MVNKKEYSVSSNGASLKVTRRNGYVDYDKS